MSGLGKVPNFEPDEETKALIESMFEQKREERKTSDTTTKEAVEDEAPQVEEEPKAKRHRVRIPEAPPQTKEQEKKSMSLAKEELDLIHDAFMDFSEVASDTIIYSHLYNEVLKLTEAFQDMETMLLDEIDQDEITQQGLGDYEKMRKIRTRVLSDIYNKYEK